MFDSAERDKLALILHGIRHAGHCPILVDAELYAAREPISAVLVDGVRGHHRTLDGSPAHVIVDDVIVLTAAGREQLVGRAKPGAARTLSEPLAVEAVWPDALDITRRLEFAGLYREIAEQGLTSLAGSWSSVLDATFKHRTRQVLAALPQPRHAVVTAELPARTLPVDVWVKAPGDTHSHGVFWVPRGQDIAPAVHQAMRPTPDGRLCLVEEDVRSIVGGERTDVAVTVLDGRAVHATVRTQSQAGRPTNSRHGGRSVAVDPGLLPTRIQRLAVDAVTATGNRYGSADIFGDWAAPVVGEVNVMPGGRSPGFLARVIDPLVAAYVSEIERRVTKASPARYRVPRH
ncbi:hypothetical protein M1L60_02255 [Actinoplanes sp. TRM 88003]|uniref:ATP-grasp domain-containing protein n=1 Tax=Paractinoplanes aksuensis TaxID=2939490 RepID=A0ABT1DEZ5_9ACTN|nr:hypothetical protein [Actinoplanes aksuensis]MCO8269409.1 hypothetical protein [Actinoplanes aksuensis]